MNGDLAVAERGTLAQLYAAIDLEDYYSSVVEIMAERFSVERFAVFLLDRKGRPFLDFSHPAELTPLDHSADCSLPLRVQDEDFGKLVLEGKAERWEAALSPFCSHLAQSLYLHKLIGDQNRVIDESLAHVQSLKAMGELLGELDTELVLNRILKFNIDLMQVEVGAARLYEKDETILEARWGLPAEVFEQLVEARRQGHVENGGCLERLVVGEDPEAAFSLESALCLPMALQPPHRAEFYLVSGEAVEMGAHQQALVASCQVIAGIALQKTLDHEKQIRQHRMNEQLEVARRIQQQLLPASLPEIPGYAMAALSQSALYVGGDYYDVVARDDGGLLAIVADVSGKGVQAAIRMSALRTLFHSMVEQEFGPADILQRLNRFLAQDSLRGHFITAFCMLLDARDGRIRLASAGHEPPLLMRPGGETRPVPMPGGLPLGLGTLVVATGYREAEFTLEAGERLLVFTDGLTDTRNDSGELFGQERALAFYTDRFQGEETELLAGLLKEMDTFRGRAPWVDDLTLLTLYRKDTEKN